MEDSTYWLKGGHGDDPDVPYDTFDKLVGQEAYDCLNHLSTDVRQLETDEFGWTDADRGAIGRLEEIDWLGRLLVPPAITPLGPRVRFTDLMLSLRSALPFSNTEREWLLRDIPPKGQNRIVGGPDVEYLNLARNTEVRLMSDGLYRTIQGRDLLQRWWNWRREVGEYGGGQGGLTEAREALRGLTELLTPELGLPEPYTQLQVPQG